MARLSLKPRYVEVEHVVNGGLEIWDSANVATGWSLTGGGNGTLNRESDAFGGLFAARIDKTASGSINIARATAKSLIPDLYYRIAGVCRTTATGLTAQIRLINVTRSTGMTSAGIWSGPSPSFASISSFRWKTAVVWTQIPSTWGSGDVYDFRAGGFAPLSGQSVYFDSFSIIGPFLRPIHLVGLAALTYAAIARKEIVVTLTSPTGLEIDITRRVKLDGLGTITEGAEEEILQLTHGDMTLTLDDRDGFLRGLLADATATDLWELVVLSETGRAHGLKWDRLFAGVLDLPWSVSFDPQELETTIQVFSFTKALELRSATGIGRTVIGRTLSITAATKTATTNSTIDLLRGDRVTARVSVAGVSTQETFTVDRVTSATAFLVKDAAQNTFTAADLTLDTYFHREKTAEFLADAVCDAGNVQSRTIGLSSELASFPLAQPIAAHGLGLVASPMSLISQAGKVVATYAATDETKRKETTGPTAAWTDGATSNLPQLDWTAYLDSEPGTIQEAIAGIPDTGLYAPAHDTAHVYRNVAGAASLMHLFQDAATDLGVSSLLTYPLTHASIEVDTTSNRVFYCFKSATAREFRYWDGAFNTISTSKSGSLRLLRNVFGLTYLALVDHVTNDIQIWNPRVTPPALVRSLPWPTTDRILNWTMRTWGVPPLGHADGVLWMSFLFERASETWVAILNAHGAIDTWSLVATYRVAGGVSAPGATPYGPKSYQTVTTLADGREVAIGYAAGEWFVLSTRLDGIVPYADFTGLSCAGALKELAVASIAYLDTDRYNVVTLIQRPGFLAASPVQTIEDPLDRTSRPIWEFYRTAVKITGKDPLGAAFTVIQGPDDGGGSAKTLEISSPLISTAGMALAIALIYRAYLNRAVRQEDIRIDEPEDRVRVLDVVTFDDLKWLVTQVDSNTSDREQSLRLFEVR